MKIEIKSEEVIEWFKDNSAPIDKTRIYLSEGLKTRGLEESYGVFLPRFYEGYITDSDNLNELIKKYVHESSHGAFFENFPVGRKIADLDKKVYEKEKVLFGSKTIEEVYVITSRNPSIKSRRITLEEAKRLSKIQFPNSREIFEVDKNEFDGYVKLSNRLNLLYNKFLGHMEGFALIVTEELMHYDYSNFPLSEPYKAGYKLLKPMEKSEGLDGLIQILYELK